MIPRLGYACINVALQSGQKKDRIIVNNTCIAKTFREKGIDYAIQLARKNLDSVLKILAWNEQHGIRLYRMSSDMFPHITNPEFIRDDKYVYSLDNFDDQFKKIGNYAKKYKHRLTFHPGQYNQIGSPNEQVFEKTVRDLSLHADVLDKIGCDLNSIIVVHGGGTYQNKEKTIARWIERFYQLPTNVQNRLVIENCERQYSYKDVLHIAGRINRPVIFDTHHYQCWSNIYGEQEHPATFMEDILKTWTDHGLIPKIHISEQAPNKKIGAHSDIVEEIPDYILSLLDKHQIDIMIEAKHKEQAVLYLYDKYYDFDFDTNLWK